MTVPNVNPSAVGGLLFIVSGPSGVGKDALLARLFAQLPGVVRSVSATTREARSGETDGIDYHFVSRAQFEADIAAEQFYEYAAYGVNLYGTPLAPVARQRAQGLDVILKIEVQGARTVRALASDAVLIFIAPPSMAELERRLRGRGTDDENHVIERLRIAQQELDCIGDYDYCIVNDDFEQAYDALYSVIVAERHRIRKSESSGTVKLQ